MPHAVFNLGPLTTTDNSIAPRSLIPGVEPGGSRAGQATKPVLLIKDAWVEPINIQLETGSAVGAENAKLSLKLSQEPLLIPGLLLPVAYFRSETRASGTPATQYTVEGNIMDIFNARGTTWAAAYVGARLEVSGAMSIDADIHLEYEVVEVPWMEWFIMWDFLDNVVDNEREY